MGALSAFASLPLLFFAADGPTAPALNIILILADDVGIEGFGCYAGESFQTPHIDALAADGALFENCHSQPLCTPSRVQLLTGLSNARNYTHFSILPPGERTLAQRLQERGYRTAVIGKWQLFGASHYADHAGTGTRPEAAGFERYCLWQVEQLGSRYWNPKLDTDGELREHGTRVYGPDVFLDYGLDFVTAESKQPFFLFYPMALPHDPFLPTPLSADRNSRDRFANLRDMVQYIDHQVGRLRGALRAQELEENTLIVFTSDNGTHTSIRSRRAGRDVAGGKALTLDTGTHVPLLLAGPGIEPGTRISDLVDFTDLMPTLAEAAGKPLTRDEPTDGVSFWPRTQGKAGQPREWSYSYYNPRPGNPRFPEVEWVRTVQHKLYADGRLFDVRADPAEAAPLASDDEATAAVRKRLRAAFEEAPRRSTGTAR